jgi:hypothetical protein
VNEETRERIKSWWMYFQTNRYGRARTRVIVQRVLLKTFGQEASKQGRNDCFFLFKQDDDICDANVLSEEGGSRGMYYAGESSGRRSSSGSCKCNSNSWTSRGKNNSETPYRIVSVAH